jgi:hypothetical protein
VGDKNAWEESHDTAKWLESGDTSLKSLWHEYRDIDFTSRGSEAGSKRPQERDRDDFELATNMARIYGDHNSDELDTWLKAPAFELDEKDTLPLYWLLQSKNKHTRRIAQMGLDMASIPAMSRSVRGSFHRPSS